MQVPDYRFDVLFCRCENYVMSVHSVKQAVGRTGRQNLLWMTDPARRVGSQNSCMSGWSYNQSTSNAVQQESVHHAFHRKPLGYECEGCWHRVVRSSVATSEGAVCCTCMHVK